MLMIARYTSGIQIEIKNEDSTVLNTGVAMFLALSDTINTYRSPFFC